MNVAFEISPLITASGTFGDKSGVYRYMIGLLDSYIQYVVKKDKNAKVVLFSLNRDLMKYPLNPDVLKIALSPNVVVLNRVPAVQGRSWLETFRDTIIMDIPILRTILKIANKILSVTKISGELSARIDFHKYYNFLDKQFKKNGVKVVHHSDTGFFNMRGYKNVVTVYDLTAISMTFMHRDDTVDLQKRKMRFTRLYADGIVAISKSTKKDLLKFSPYFAQKHIVVCYPGIDKAFLRRSGKSEGSLLRINKILSKKKIKIPTGKYLLYYGTFEPRKNLLYLVRAFCDLVDEGLIPSDFKLIMTGGEGWGEVKKMIKDYIAENYQTAAESRVVLINYMNDDRIIDFIQNAAGVVYPSLYEGFGLPVLESMSLGTPVICSNTSSLPEVGGSSVLYVDPQNFFDLKEKIKLLINDKNLATDLSKRSPGQAKKFTWQKSAKQLSVFFEHL